MLNYMRRIAIDTLTLTYSDHTWHVLDLEIYGITHVYY